MNFDQFFSTAMSPNFTFHFLLWYGKYPMIILLTQIIIYPDLHGYIEELLEDNPLSESLPESYLKNIKNYG